MMNKLSNFTTGLFLRKLAACVVLFCIVISSAGAVSVNANISVMESAKVSADTLISQFFYVSSFPIDVITSMFVEKNQKDSLSASSTKKQNENDKTKNEAGGAKASSEYSILPNTISFLYFSKSGVLKINKYANDFKEFKIFDYGFLNRSYFKNLNLLFEFNVIMTLLLMILLSRRKLSDDNILVKLINNNKKKIARLV